jgi:hypothetical protein
MSDGIQYRHAADLLDGSRDLREKVLRAAPTALIREDTWQRAYQDPTGEGVAVVRRVYLETDRHRDELLKEFPHSLQALIPIRC